MEIGLPEARPDIVASPTPQEGSLDMSAAVTRTTEPKPGWWSSLIGQLKGRSVDRTIDVDASDDEQDSTASVEVQPVEMELVDVAELESTEPALEQAPAIEPEVPEPEIDRHAAPIYDPDLIAAGRAWIGESVWSDMEPDYVAELTDDEVISGIARHYDGGVHAFEESGYDVAAEPELGAEELGAAGVYEKFLEEVQGSTFIDDLNGPDSVMGGLQEETILIEEEPDAPSKETKAHIVSVYGRAACTGERAPSDAVEIHDPTDAEKCPDCVQWDKDCAHQLVMDLQDTQIAEELAHPAEELDGQAGEVTIEDVEPAAVEELAEVGAKERNEVHTAAPEDGVCELPGSAPEVAKPEPVLTDTQQKAVIWTNALEDGTHTQAHGVWQKDGFFGGVRAECTIRAGGNVLGLTDHEMKETFGDELFYDVLDRNDHEHQDYRQISKAIKKDQGIEDLEMER